jgi:predicted regulator of Ras-like GTPase activity (Roadblock/LC7/MglB family)
MFGFFKNLLRRTPESGGQSVSENYPMESEQPSAAIENQPRVVHPPRAYHSRSSAGISIPLEAVLRILPLELQARVQRTEATDLAITVPLEKILAQLSRGVVRIPFGDVRHAAPHFFRPEPDRDRELVALPLSEILPRLNPALIQRRRVQRHIDVPQEILSPFDGAAAFDFDLGKGEPAAPSLDEMRSEAAFEEAPAPEPPPLRNSRMPMSAPATGALSYTLAPVPAVANNFVPPATPVLAQIPPPPPMPVSPVAVEPVAPVEVAAPVDPEAAQQPELSEATPLPQPEPAPLAVPVHANGKGDPLWMNLAQLAEAWPESVRKEIVALGLVEARVGLPVEAIEQSLKQGRIVFSWRSVRSWIAPAPVAGPSPLDSLAVELPLKLVAPLFLERQKAQSKHQHRVAIDEDIPNLFFGFPQPQAPVAENARPSDTNYYVWDDQADQARVDVTAEKRTTPTPGTRFVAKYATPNEIVSRAAALDGVAGSLIALPDGLMVASRLPRDLNGDTLAAFLPQIFGKVSQCTKELRMGELNNLNFTVGNVPWKIFRVNSIFFAAFGRAGEPLPTAKLAAMAAELDHKPKN